jgi:hypothetical protein
MESLKRSFADAVGEFLDSGDVGEAARIIGSLVATGADDSDVSIVCPKQAFKVAMDRGEQALEMAASLLSSLVVRAVMSVGSLCVGLRACVESLEDLKFDNPRAAAHFCGFVAYFLVDGALTDHDVTSLTEGFPALRERIEFAESRPLRRVKEIVRSFVEEYLSVHASRARARLSVACARAFWRCVRAHTRVCRGRCVCSLAADIGEVDLAVFRLHARHCHHEVVKKIAQSTLAGGAFGTPFARESASQLLASLRRSERISADQFEEGFLRLYRDLPQLCLDEPRAWDTVARFTWRAMSDGVLAPSFASGLAGGAPEHRKFGEALAELRAAAEAAASVSTPHGGGTWGIPAAMTDMATLNAHVSASCAGGRGAHARLRHTLHRCAALSRASCVAAARWGQTMSARPSRSSTVRCITMRCVCMCVCACACLCACQCLYM